MALRLGPNAKLPKVLELCSDLGVSKITVGRALDVLEEQGVLVRRHGVGIYVSPSLARRPVQKILLLCDAALLQKTDQSPFWRALIETIHERSEDEDEYLTMHLMSGRAKPAFWRQQLLSLYNSGQLDGVLGIHIPEEVGAWLQEGGVPAVCYATYSPYMVQVDTASLIYMSVQELWNQGCRRIGLWSAITPYTENVHHYLSPEKLYIYEHLQAQGTPIEIEDVENSLDLIDNAARMTTLTQQEQGYNTAIKVFSRPREEWPDGIFVAEDSTARGALTAFEKLGIRIGEDVFVASHLNKGSDTLLGYEDKLILAEVDLKEIVQSLFNVLEALMKGDTSVPQATIISPRLRTPW